MLQLSQLSVRWYACKPLQTHQQTDMTSIQPRISCRQCQLRRINRVTSRTAANTHRAQPLQASSVETISDEAVTAEEAASAERPAGTALVGRMAGEQAVYLYPGLLQTNRSCYAGRGNIDIQFSGCSI